MRSAFRQKRLEVAALVSMGAIYFFSYFQRSAVPGTVFNELQADLRLSASEVASMGAVFLGVYAWMQLFVGVAADRFGGRRTLLFGGVLMTAGAAVFPLCHSKEMLYASRAVTGFGASFMYLSIVKEIDTLFGPRHFAAILGCMLFIGYSGGIAATLPFERAVAAWGWRHALLGAAALTAMLLVAGWAVLRRVPHTHRAAPLSLRPLGDIARNRANLPLFGWSLINFPVYFVMQAVFGKKFLQDFAGLSSAGAASVLLLMVSVCAGATFSGGFLLRWTAHRRKPVLIGTSILILAAALLLLAGVLWRAPAWALLLPLLLLALAPAAGPASAALAKELNPPETAAQSVATMNFTAYIGVATLTHLCGIAMDLHEDSARVTSAGTVYPPEAYAWMFALLAVAALACLVASFYITETHGRSFREAPGPRERAELTGTGA